MKAFILAAGRGSRMQPLTDTTPKPLLHVAGKPLIVHHIEHLKMAAFTDIVINTGWLGEQLPEALGSGETWGVNIQYSHEGWPALETAGGIKNALPLLGEEAFLVINGDVWSEVGLLTRLKTIQTNMAHLILVENPAHNPSGDFAIKHNTLDNEGEKEYTYSGIGVYHPNLFEHVEAVTAPLGPILREHAAQGVLTAEVYTGDWMDVGTPERLQTLNKKLRGG